MMCFSARSSFVLEFASGGPKAAPRGTKHLSCRAFRPAGASGGVLRELGDEEEGRGRVLAGIFSHAVGFSLRPLSSKPLWKHQKGGLSGCASRQPFRRRGSKLSGPRSSWWSQLARSGPEGRLLALLFCSGSFSGPNRTKLSFELHKSQHLAMPGATRRIS